MEYTESLQAPPGTHGAGRLPQNLAYEAQVCFTLAWPDRTASLRVICMPTWRLANAGLMGEYISGTMIRIPEKVQSDYTLHIHSRTLKEMLKYTEFRRQ